MLKKLLIACVAVCVVGLAALGVRFAIGSSVARSDNALNEKVVEAKLRAMENPAAPDAVLDPGVPGGPQVVEATPADRAVDVPVETELRLRFDKPMNSARIAIALEKGGLANCGAPRYDAQTQAFVLPVRLLPGTEYQIVANKDVAPYSSCFRSTEGVHAGGYRWSFLTAGTAAKTGEKPKVISVSPGAEVTMGLLTPFTITFDRAMDPSLFKVQPMKDGKPCTDYSSSPHFYEDVEYDLKENRFTLPVGFPMNWEGDLEFSGFRSAEGSAADPYVLYVKSGTDPLSAGLRERLAQAAKDPRLLSLLARMQAASKGLTSLSETFRSVQCSYGGQSGPYTDIFGMGTTTRFQGERQFFADGSDVMGSAIFVVGCDGEQWWNHIKSQGVDHLRVLPFDEMQDQDILIGNPFGLRQGDIPKIIEEEHLEYLGIEEIDGRSCHVLRATTVAGEAQSCATHISRLYVDADRLLPVRVQNFFGGIMNVGDYTYDRINQAIPDEEFALPSIEGVALEAEESLGEGYDTHEVIIHDGGGNWPAVRWGKRGPKGSSSSGFS